MENNYNISHKEANVRRFSESTPDLCSSNIDVNFNMEDRSTSSNSSLGPTSAFSYADAERSPKVIKDLDRESTLNDYIASHMVPLPDLSNAMTESEDDDNASISSSILIEGNWEDNWLFRKKRPSITTSMTGSIGMLIPAPKDDVRAQIGDKTTDEISDLSEMESDTDDSSLKIYSSLDPRSDRILNKHLIGGQNTKGILDELIETASLVSNTSLPRSESNYFETMNKHVLEVASKTEAFNSCIASNSPQEEEIKLKSKPKNYYEDHLTPETENNSLSGSIAEREYKKWYNAVEMPNNPYSPEALERRISGSQERFIDLPNINSSTNKNVITITETTKAEEDSENEHRSDIGYKRYSRDYYINADNTPKVSPKHQIHRNDRRKRLSSGCSDEHIADTGTKEVNSYGKNAYKSIPLYSDHSDCHWILSTPVRRSSSLKCINHRSPQKSFYNFTPNAASTVPTYYKILPPQPRSFTSASHYDNLDRIHLQTTKLQNDSYKCTSLISNKTRHNEYENKDGSFDIDDKIDLDYCIDDKRSQLSWRSASVATNYSETLPKRRTLSSLSYYNNSIDTSLNSSKFNNLILSNSNILSQFEKQLLHKDLKRNSFRAISSTTKDFVMNPLYERENIRTANADSINSKNRANILTEGVSDDQIDSGVDSFLHCFAETDTYSGNTSLFK
uniref:Uridine-cytidine kinase D n=1 Tax=Zeugodacus cucurbitae TaxID=28588 RepID=A0A0A1X681_ZEUCU